MKNYKWSFLGSNFICRLGLKWRADMVFANAMLYHCAMSGHWAHMSSASNIKKMGTMAMLPSSYVNIWCIIMILGSYFSADEALSGYEDNLDMQTNEHGEIIRWIFKIDLVFLLPNKIYHIDDVIMCCQYSDGFPLVLRWVAPRVWVALLGCPFRWLVSTKRFNSKEKITYEKCHLWKNIAT